MRIAKRWTMAVLLLCVAALIGGLATRTERGAAWLSEASGGRLASPEAEGASAADAALAAAADGAGQQAGSTAASPSSPPRDDDGDDLLSLMRRAEAGDTHAQCEVASVVINCEGAKKYVDGLRRTREMHMERVRTLPESDLLRAESERWLERSRIHGDPVYIAFDECKQPYQPSRADVLRLLRESAESGDPVAVDVYLSGRLLQDENEPEIRQERLLYQTRAEAIARRAVARGNVVAALMLAQAYVQPDDARADLSLSLLPTAVTQDLPNAVSHLHALRNALDAYPPGPGRDRLMELADSMALAFRNALPEDELARAMAKAPVMPRHLGIRKLERSINVLTRENGINPRDCR